MEESGNHNIYILLLLHFALVLLLKELHEVGGQNRLIDTSVLHVGCQRVCCRQTVRHGCQLPGLDVSFTRGAVGHSPDRPGHTRYVYTLFNTACSPRAAFTLQHSTIQEDKLTLSLLL